MENEDFFVARLEAHGIRPTATRLLVLRQLFRGGEMISLPELERRLPTVDKSTISRALTLFLSHGLLHAVDDGLGATKYALSDDDEGSALPASHIHFCCTRCERTFCLERIHTPVVGLPAGFVAQEINYIVKGLCPDCRKNDERRI